MAASVKCELDIEVLGRRLELEGTMYDEHVDVTLSQASLDELDAQPLGQLADISQALTSVLNLAGSGPSLFDQISGQLKNIKPLEDAKELFLSLAVYLTELHFESGKSLSLGVRISAEQGQIPPLLGIQVVSLGVTVTVDLSSSE